MPLMTAATAQCLLRMWQAKKEKSHVQRRAKQRKACLGELLLPLGAALPLPSCTVKEKCFVRQEL